LIKSILCMSAALLFSAAANAGPRIWREPLTGMPFVAIAKGCFQMGSKTPMLATPELALTHLRFDGNLSADERPQHEVCVDAFLIGQYEVQADDWIKVMGSKPPAGSGKAPASGISWDAAQEFARRLTQQSAGKHRFRLPTEAEWEYACRAGAKKELVPYRKNKVDVAWYSMENNHLQQPSPVGQLKANAWGLYDMLGNVWEWVEDAYRADGYASHGLYNPLVKEALHGERVIRGASYRSEYVQVRCANRGFYAADDALGQIGLRLVGKPQ
jgi:formylglycine-generating enzyme required for sulfatase activity